MLNIAQQFRIPFKKTCW